MFSQPSPVRPAATGSETAAKMMGRSLPSKTLLALWAVEVAMGIRISTPLLFSFCRMVLRAEVSPFAFWVSISKFRPLASSWATMVSRI